MAMMEVRIVRVLVAHRRVLMPVCVRFARRFAHPMDMLVVLVVNVTMLMFQRLVAVLMVMAFREVEVDADRHQDRRPDQLNGDRLAEQ